VAGTTLQDAQRKLLDAEAAAPTVAQRTLIEDAERLGLPGLHARAQLLRERIKASADERGRLERQYTKIPTSTSASAATRKARSSATRVWSLPLSRGCGSASR
jgi:hypothetical protein